MTASRSANFGRIPEGSKSPSTSPVSSNATFSERENILHGDDLALHAGDFGQAGHLARAIAETSQPARQHRQQKQSVDGLRCREDSDRP